MLFYDIIPTHLKKKDLTMYWTNTELLEYLIDAEKLIITKKKLKAVFPKKYKKIKKIQKFIEEEMPFLNLTDKKNGTIIIKNEIKNDFYK